VKEESLQKVMIVDSHRIQIRYLPAMLACLIGKFVCYLQFVLTTDNGTSARARARTHTQKREREEFGTFINKKFKN
jgi:hypothetical protein